MFWTVPVDCAPITLVLCFFASQNALQPLVRSAIVVDSSLSFDRNASSGLCGAMASTSALDGAIRAEADQFFHIRIRSHDLAGSIDGRKVSGVGRTRHGSRDRPDNVDRWIAPALGSSRLRSPTSPMMEMSADTLRATVDKSTDLPTPDPEKPNRA